MRRLRTLRWLQLVCAGASFFTTMAGFHHLIGGGSGGMGLGGVAVAALFSGIVQCFVVVTVDELTRPSFGLRWPLALGGFLVFFFVSSTFSIGFYFRLFSAEDFAEAQLMRQSELMLDEATRVRGAFQGVVDRLDRLSAYATQMSARERDVGGTCANSRGPGEGPAMRKRSFEAARHQMLAEGYRARLARIESSVKQIRQVRTSSRSGQTPQIPQVEALRQPWSEIRSALMGTDLRPVLEPLIRFESEGFPVGDPAFQAFEGPRNACKDPSSIARMRDVLATPMPVLPDVEITQLDATDPKKVIFLVANGLADWVRGVVPRPGSVAITDKAFLPALGFGVVVDLGILLLGFFLAVARRGFNRSPAARLVAVTTDLIPSWAPVSAELRRRSVRGASSAWGGDDMSEVHNRFRALRQVLFVREGRRAWLFVHRHEHEHEIYDHARPFARLVSGLLEEALWVLQRERLVRRAPAEVPETFAPARLLAARLGPLGEVIVPAARREHFAAYEVLADLDELEARSPRSGPVSDCERIEGATPRLLGRRVSRFFTAQCAARPQVVAGHLKARVQRRLDRIFVPLRGIGVPPAILDTWLSAHGLAARSTWFGERWLGGRVDLSPFDHRRLEALAAGRLDPAALGDAEPRARLAECVQAIRGQDLSGYTNHPTRTPWGLLADAAAELADRLRREAPPDAIEGLAWAAVAYLHCGEMVAATRLLSSIDRDALATAGPTERLLVRMVDLDALIDERPEWGRMEELIEQVRERIVAGEDEVDPLLRGAALGTVGRALNAYGRERHGRGSLEAALEIHVQHAPEEVARSRIYLAAALRAQARGSEPADEGLLEQASEQLAQAACDLDQRTRPVAPAYASETEIFCRYESARCLLAQDRAEEAARAASEGLRGCRGREWPTLGLLRTRAVARKRAGDEKGARLDQRAITAIRHGTATGSIAKLAIAMLRDVREGRDSTFY